VGKVYVGCDVDCERDVVGREGAVALDIARRDRVSLSISVRYIIKSITSLVLNVCVFPSLSLGSLSTGK
jgi:hypothetical protein